MMWIALLIALVLALAALAYVVWPLLRPGPAPVMVEDDRLTELLGRKDAVMLAIKELEFDYHVGKLSEEDYQLYDGRLRRQAVGLLQQIEQMAPMSAQLDTTLEAEIASRRRVAEPAMTGTRQPAAPALVVAGAPPAARVATAAVTGTAPINGNGVKPRFCTNCGNAVDANHKFCANCGAPIGA
jgi:hypothetical protein